MCARGPGDLISVASEWLTDDDRYVGIDLELADVAAARYQLRACQQSGRLCAHNPVCVENLNRLLAHGPSEFPYRRFADINEIMRATGMGYEAEPERWPLPVDVPDGGRAHEDRQAVDLRWRAQTIPGEDRHS